MNRKCTHPHLISKQTLALFLESYLVLTLFVGFCANGSQFDRDEVQRIQTARTSLEVFGIKKSRWEQLKADERESLARTSRAALLRKYHPDKYVNASAEDRDLAEKMYGKIRDKVEKAYLHLTGKSQRGNSISVSEVFDEDLVDPLAARASRQQAAEAEANARVQRERVREASRAQQKAESDRRSKNAAAREAQHLRQIYEPLQQQYSMDIIRVLENLGVGKLTVKQGSRALEGTTAKFIESLEVIAGSSPLSGSVIAFEKEQSFDQAWRAIRDHIKLLGVAYKPRYIHRPFESLSRWVGSSNGSVMDLSSESLANISVMTYGYALSILDPQRHVKQLVKIQGHLDIHLTRYTGTRNWMEQFDWPRTIDHESKVAPQNRSRCTKSLAYNFISDVLTLGAAAGTWYFLVPLF